MIIIIFRKPYDLTLSLGLQTSRFSFACQKSYLRVDIFHKENFIEMQSRQTFFFFFRQKKKKKRRKFKNKVAVSSTQYQKSALFSLQYIYNDLSKSTEILSVRSFCFYRLFSDSIMHLQTAAFIYR